MTFFYSLLLFPILIFAQAPIDSPKFSLEEYNIKPKEMNGIQFPRTGNTAYRGMGYKQLSRVKAIKAMLGDSLSIIETKVITVMINMIDGNPDPNPWLRSSPPRYFELEKFYKTAVSKFLKNKPSPSKKEKYDFVRQVIEKKFLSLKKKRIYEEMINSIGHQYIDWNPEGIFGSYFYETARHYSPYVTLIKEQGMKRSVDLNYRSYIDHGRWGQGYADDAGEVLFPLYIPAHDIEGFFVQEDRNSNLKEVYMSVEHLGEKYVLIIDLAKIGNKIVVKKNNQIYISQSDIINRYGIDEASQNLHSASEKKAKAFALIKLCSNSTTCEISKEVLKFFNVKNDGQQISVELLEELKELKSDFQPKVFYSDDKIKFDKLTN